MKKFRGFIGEIPDGYVFMTIFVVAVALAQGIGRVGCDVFGKVMLHIMRGELM